jgi:predicted RNase H-like nuclease (RuvC/YqgF family)
MLNLVQVQTKTEAQMDLVSDKMSREEKTTDLLLKCFLQTQQSVKEMRAFLEGSILESTTNRSKRKNAIECDSDDDEENERTTEEQREEKKKKLSSYETELKETQQKLLKSETENSDLRRVLEKMKRKLKQQESQLADLNSNYSQALSSAKTHWESRLLERERAILKWKQQYDALMDDNRKLESICARNTRQLREGQMLESANRTLTSLNSGKLIRVGGEGGTGSNGESVLLNTTGGSLTTVETLRRANKANGNLNDSFFECFTSKKESNNNGDDVK